MPDFSATIDAWATKTEKRAEAIWKQATQKTASIAQSRIPVETGFARSSIRASTSAMPPIEKGSHGQRGQTYSYDSGEIVATIAGARLGGTLFIGWTAGYIGELEKGHSQQAPSGFLRLAAMEWPQIVAETVAEAKSRAS